MFYLQCVFKGKKKTMWSQRVEQSKHWVGLVAYLAEVLLPFVTSQKRAARKKNLLKLVLYIFTIMTH